MNIHYQKITKCEPSETIGDDKYREHSPELPCASTHPVQSNRFIQIARNPIKTINGTSRKSWKQNYIVDIHSQRNRWQTSRFAIDDRMQKAEGNIRKSKP